MFTDKKKSEAPKAYRIREEAEPRVGSPATGASESPGGNVPPQQPTDDAAKAIPTTDESALNKDSVLDLLVRKEQTDEEREHAERGAGDLHGANEGSDLTGSFARASDPDHKDVIVKLGSAQEAEYVHEGDIVSSVNRVSGEVTFRVGRDSPSFTSVRSTDVLKDSSDVKTSGTGAVSNDPPMNADGSPKKS